MGKKRVKANRILAEVGVDIKHMAQKVAGRPQVAFEYALRYLSKTISKSLRIIGFAT